MPIGAAKMWFRNPAASGPSGPTGGYFFGGNTGATTASVTADAITFATDTTIAKTSANLPDVRREQAGVSNGSTAGYMSGGAGNGNPRWIYDASKVTYSNDTTAACTTANRTIDGGLGEAAITNGSTAGYFLGGSSTGPSQYINTDKLTYSSEITAAATTANLTWQRDWVSGMRATTFGYAAAGRGPGVVYYSSVDKLTFATDVTADSTASALTAVCGASVSVSEGTTKGYFIQGWNGSIMLGVGDKITFSTDVVAACTTANLTTAVGGVGGMNGGSAKGYVCGGQNLYTGAVTNVGYTVTFSSDSTAAATSTNLSLGRGGIAAFSKGAC